MSTTCGLAAGFEGETDVFIVVVVVVFWERLLATWTWVAGLFEFDTVVVVVVVVLTVVPGFWERFSTTCTWVVGLAGVTVFVVVTVVVVLWLRLSTTWGTGFGCDVALDLFSTTFDAEIDLILLDI